MKDEDICWECNSRLKSRNVDYFLYGIKIGKFPARVCEKCNETYFSEGTSRRMTMIAKEKGLWGLQARTKIGKVGNSLDIKIPRKIRDFLNLKKGEEITIHPEGKGKIVISF